MDDSLNQHSLRNHHVPPSVKIIISPLIKTVASKELLTLKHLKKTYQKEGLQHNMKWNKNAIYFSYIFKSLRLTERKKRQGIVLNNKS